MTQRQDRFGQGYDRLHFDSGENWSWGPETDGVVRPWTSAIDVDGDGQLESLSRPYSAVPDQLDQFFRIGHTLNNSVNISGALNNFTYYLSYANARQEGIMDNTSYDRNSLNLNSSARFSDKLKSSFKVSYSYTDQNTSTEGSRAFEGANPYAMVLQSPNTIPWNEVRDYKSPYHDINGYWGSYSSVNPYFILNEYGNEGNIHNVFSKFDLTYSPFKNFDIIGRVGVNYVNTGIEEWTPPYTPDQQLIWGDGLALSTRNARHNSVGSYANESIKTTNLDFTALGVYNTTLDANGDFSLDVTAGWNMFDRRFNRLRGETSGGLVVPGWVSCR